MGRLFFLFIIGSIGMLLRFIILGDFEINQLILLFAFPVAAIIAWQILRHLKKIDSNYEPKDVSDHMWSTYIGDRFSTGLKQLFKGNQRTADFQRFYLTKWQRFVNEIISGRGNWYVHLAFQYDSADVYTFTEQGTPKLKSNTKWQLTKNDQVIGAVNTNFSLENTMKLENSLSLEFNNDSYTFKAASMDDKTEVLLNGSVIAEGKRQSGLRSQYCFEVRDGFQDIEPILAMTYVLFNYAFEK